VSDNLVSTKLNHLHVLSSCCIPIFSDLRARRVRVDENHRPAACIYWPPVEEHGNTTHQCVVQSCNYLHVRGPLVLFVQFLLAWSIDVNLFSLEIPGNRSTVLGYCCKAEKLFLVYTVSILALF